MNLYLSSEINNVKYDLNKILSKISSISSKCMNYLSFSYENDDIYFNHINNAYLFLTPFSIAYLFSNTNENNLEIDLFKNYEKDNISFSREKANLLILSLNENQKAELLYKINDTLDIYLKADSNCFIDIEILEYHNNNKNKIINTLLSLIVILE